MCSDLENPDLTTCGLVRRDGPRKGGISLQLPQRQSVNTREFLVFNQELATLLKAGMPIPMPIPIPMPMPWPWP